jgi:hypothetical protein
MGGDLLVLAIVLLGIGSLLAVLLAVWLISRFLSGIWLGAMIAAICIASWSLLYFKLVKPYARDQAILSFRGQVFNDCDSVLKVSPKEVIATSLTDEMAGLTDDQLVQLLAERGLDFVELKIYRPMGIAPNWADFSRYIPPDSLARVSAERPYARITIAPNSDPFCVLRDSGPERRVPVLPGHCLRVEPISEPRGSHRIEGEPAELSGQPKAGALRLVERATGQLIAQLPSAHTEGMGNGYGPLRSMRYPVDGASSYPDCRVPHSRLAEMLVSEDSTWRQTDSRFIHPVQVGGDDVFEHLEQLQTADLPVVQLKEPDRRRYTEAERLWVFSPWARDEGWQLAVDRARQLGGVVPYGGKLIDLKRRELVSLKAQTRSFWQVHALQTGFLLWKDAGLGTGEARPVVHLDSCGRFAWAIGLQFPPETPKQTDAPFRAVSIEGKELVLSQFPQWIPGDESRPLEGLIWKVPLAKLPAMTPGTGAKSCGPR